MIKIFIFFEYFMKRKCHTYIFLFYLGFIPFTYSQLSQKAYIPTKDRFRNFDQQRIIIVDKKPLSLNPFELFDIMTFENVYTGMFMSLHFVIPELKENIIFQEGLNKIIYNGNFNDSLAGISNNVKIKLDCLSGDSLIRKIYQKKKYKLIYCFSSDSELHRKPFPTEHNDGYYIVDIVEINQKFERESFD